jgi:hypothetical protein
MLTLLKEGRNEADKEIGMNFIKNAFVYASGGLFYKYYTQVKHDGFIANAANASYLAQSNVSYPVVNTDIFTPSGGSLHANARNRFISASNEVKALENIAGIAEKTAKITDLASKILAFTPATGIAAALKLVSAAAQGANIGIQGGAMLTAGAAIGAISKESENILTKAQLNGSLSDEQSIKGLPVHRRISIASLTLANNNYNAVLDVLRNQYTLSYDSANLFPKLNATYKPDSTFLAEARSTLAALWSSADSAQNRIASFVQKANRIVDTIMVAQNGLKGSFIYLNLAYIQDPDKTGYTNNLISKLDSIKLLNNQLFTALSQMADSLNFYQIPSHAYLVQTGYSINHSRIIGQPGTVTYKFTNFGSEIQTAVRFKMEKPTGGYQITTGDSVFVGNINPGETKTVSFSFATPMADSIGRYTITVNANNGLFQNVEGTLFAIDPGKHYTVRDGNWSSPSTWNKGVVPSINSVVDINHKVLIDVDAACKKLNHNYFGEITLASGVKLNIKQ